MPSTWIMSHGTAAPAPGIAAGNGHPRCGGLPASRGLPSPRGVPADDGRAASAPPAVRVRGVRRSFEAELAPVRALRGLDLDVPAGEFIALMGPSGCGKSTLLNLIAGLDRPDEGSVEVAGERIDGRNEEWLARFRRQHVGVIFQFFSLLDGVSVRDNLTLPGILGGMRRLAIARALVNHPDLLLADEPTGALDSEGAQEVLALLRQLHASGQTIIMVTHAPEVTEP